MTEWITVDRVRALLPVRPQDGHKGTFGHVYIVGGSPGFTGAVKLAGLAAARSGVGLVTLGIPETLAPVIASGLLEVMWQALPARPEGIANGAIRPALDTAERMNAAAIGCGIGRAPETARFVREFVRACPCPLVIDADALNAVAADLEVLRDAPAPRILTPHPGEMGRLCGCTAADVQAAREGMAQDFAARCGCVVVLKGRHTVIAGPGTGTVVNPTGNAGLGTGGTGDVLAGLLAGLLAQGMAAFDAAVAGAYVQGLAGDMAAAVKTQRGLIAGDVIDYLPHAWRQLEINDVKQGEEGSQWR